MLPAERREKMISLLKEQKIATTEKLAEALNVSCKTVRRDQAICQQEGRVQRCHGGAIISRRTVLEASYDQ